MTRQITIEKSPDKTVEKTNARLKLVELDILRIISCLIVVILIHIPNDYAYTFYIELPQYTGFLLHTLGIKVAMGSFAFLSGFGLYLNKNNRNINTYKKLSTFVKKRFLRIFPLYWIALVLFLIYYYYAFNYAFLEFDVLYIIAHIFGLQIIFAPITGPPLLTLWFIGIIVIYYLIFIVLSYMGSIKKIIPTAIIILFLFAFLNIFLGLVEYRFFFYYLLFIAGIIAANIYTSPQYNKIKERIISKKKSIPLFIALLTAVLTFIIYLSLANLWYTNFNSVYGTVYLEFILDLQPGIIESASAILFMDLIIITYIIFAISLFCFFIGVFRLLFPGKNIGSIFSIIAFSTYCVYLFHRIFLAIYDLFLIEVLNIDVYLSENLYIVLIFVPFIFLFSYFIQKGVDGILKLPSKVKSRRLTINEKKNC